MASNRYSTQSLKSGAGYSTGAGPEASYSAPAAAAQLVDPETIYTKQNIIGRLPLVCGLKAHLEYLM